MTFNETKQFNGEGAGVGELEPDQEAKDLKFLAEIFEEIKSAANSGLKGAEYAKHYYGVMHRLIRENPDYGLLTQTLFGARNLAISHEILSRNPKGGRTEDKDFRGRLKDRLLELTEWNYSATVLFRDGNISKEFAQSFWQIFFKVCGLFSKYRGMEKYKRGIIGQVGVHRLLSACGLSPSLAHPEDDALRKYDFICHLPDELLLIQSKYTTKVAEPRVEIVNDITLPAFLLKDENGEAYIAEDDARNVACLAMSCRNLSKKLSKENDIKVEGMYIQIPDGSFDPDTGEINDGLIETVRRRLVEKFGLRKGWITADDFAEYFGGARRSAEQEKPLVEKNVKEKAQKVRRNPLDNAKIREQDLQSQLQAQELRIVELEKLIAGRKDDPDSADQVRSWQVRSWQDMLVFVKKLRDGTLGDIEEIKVEIAELKEDAESEAEASSNLVTKEEGESRPDHSMASEDLAPENIAFVVGRGDLSKTARGKIEYFQRTLGQIQSRMETTEREMEKLTKTIEKSADENPQKLESLNKELGIMRGTYKQLEMSRGRVVQKILRVIDRAGRK